MREERGVQERERGRFQERGRKREMRGEEEGFRKEISPVSEMREMRGGRKRLSGERKEMRDEGARGFPPPQK